MLNFSSRNFPDLTDCFPDTLKRAGSVPHLLVDRVPFFGDNLSVGFFDVKSDNRNPGDVNKVNVSLLFFFHQIYYQILEVMVFEKILFCTFFASLTTQVEKIETEISSIQFMLFTTQGTTASSEQISGAHWMMIWLTLNC